MAWFYNFSFLFMCFKSNNIFLLPLTKICVVLTSSFNNLTLDFSVKLFVTLIKLYEFYFLHLVNMVLSHCKFCKMLDSIPFDKSDKKMSLSSFSHTR